MTHPQGDDDTMDRRGLFQCQNDYPHYINQILHFEASFKVLNKLQNNVYFAAKTEAIETLKFDDIKAIQKPDKSTARKIKTIKICTLQAVGLYPTRADRLGSFSTKSDEVSRDDMTTDEISLIRIMLRTANIRMHSLMHRPTNEARQIKRDNITKQMLECSSRSVFTRSCHTAQPKINWGTTTIPILSTKTRISPRHTSFTSSNLFAE